jgi:hypothetical protein
VVHLKDPQHPRIPRGLPFPFSSLPFRPLQVALIPGLFLLLLVSLVSVAIFPPRCLVLTATCKASSELRLSIKASWDLLFFFSFFSKLRAFINLQYLECCELILFSSLPDLLFPKHLCANLFDQRFATTQLHISIPWELNGKGYVNTCAKNILLK